MSTFRLRNTRDDYIVTVIGIFLIMLSVGFAKDLSSGLCYGAAIGFAIVIIGRIVVILKKENGRKKLQAQLNAKIIELKKHQVIVNTK